MVTNHLTWIFKLFICLNVSLHSYFIRLNANYNGYLVIGRDIRFQDDTANITAVQNSGFLCLDRLYNKQYIQNKTVSIDVGLNKLYFDQHVPSTFNINNMFNASVVSITFRFAEISVISECFHYLFNGKNYISRAYMSKLCIEPNCNNGKQLIKPSLKIIADSFIITQHMKHICIQQMSRSQRQQISSQSQDLSIRVDLSQSKASKFNDSDLIIYDTNQNIIPSQINIVANQSQRFEYPCKYTLFTQSTMKSLTFETMFTGVETVENKAVIGKITQLISITAPVHIGNNVYYSLIFDNTTMRLSQILNNNISQIFDIENQFSQYQSSGDVYGDGLPNSGAYLDNQYRMLENVERSINMKINLVFRERNGINMNSNFGCGRDIDAEKFACSICEINMQNNSFTYDFDVVSGLISGWYQRPYIVFVMFDTNNNGYGYGLFKGVITRILSVKQNKI